MAFGLEGSVELMQNGNNQCEIWKFDKNFDMHQSILFMP